MAASSDSPIITDKASDSTAQKETIPITPNPTGPSMTVPPSGPGGGAPHQMAFPVVNHHDKPEKFNGLNFKRWQQKMLFYLTTLNLARFLKEDPPRLPEDPDVQAVSALDAWKHCDFLCRNYLMNSLTDDLYNVYIGVKSAKELWETLDKKYKTEDAGAKKFIVGKLFDFKMVDTKSVMSQVQEFQVIIHDIHAEGMVISETFQVAAIIEKLPPGWQDNYY